MYTKRHPPSSNFTKTGSANRNGEKAHVIIRPAGSKQANTVRQAGLALKLEGDDAIIKVPEEVVKVFDSGMFIDYHVPIEERVKMRHMKTPIVLLNPIQTDIKRESSPASVITISDSESTSEKEDSNNGKKSCPCRTGFVDGPNCHLGEESPPSSVHCTDVCGQVASLAYDSHNFLESTSNINCNSLESACNIKNCNNLVKSDTTCNNKLDSVDEGILSSITHLEKQIKVESQLNHGDIIAALSEHLKGKQSTTAYSTVNNSLADGCNVLSVTCISSGGEKIQKNMQQDFPYSQLLKEEKVAKQTTEILEQDSGSVNTMLNCQQSSSPVKQPPDLVCTTNDMVICDCFQAADGQMILIPRTNNYASISQTVSGLVSPPETKSSSLKTSSRSEMECDQSRTVGCSNYIACANSEITLCDNFHATPSLNNSHVTKAIQTKEITVDCNAESVGNGVLLGGLVPLEYRQGHNNANKGSIAECSKMLLNDVAATVFGSTSNFMQEDDTLPHELNEMSNDGNDVFLEITEDGQEPVVIDILPETDGSQLTNGISCTTPGLYNLQIATSRRKQRVIKYVFLCVLIFM